MFDASFIADATSLLAACRAKGVTLATAESCTGGLIMGLLTSIAGSSDVVDRGFITYTNASKHEMLGVDTALIEAHGAVSAQVAGAMAEGARAQSKAGIALSVTGIAGPGGGTETKPVGLVYIGVARAGGKVQVEEYHFPGDRQAVRLAAVKTAIALASSALA